MVPAMKTKQWKTGDTCLVTGEGDQLFVVMEVSGKGARLSGSDLRDHGREPFSKMSRPDPKWLAAQLKLALRRAAFLTLAVVKA